MQKNTISKIVASLGVGLLTLTAGMTAKAQSYSNAVMALNPVGYWPLNETTPPPAAFSTSLVASNSGTLGVTGNGYYGAWYQPSGNTWYLTNNISLTNGIAGAGDNALWCNAKSTGAGSGANAGDYVIVPRTSGGVQNTSITLKPPFSIEAWVIPIATSSGTYGIVAEGGASLNYGGPNTNNPFYGGTGGGYGYAGVVVGQYGGFFLFDCFNTNALAANSGKANELDSPSSGANAPLAGKWNHLVCTYDGTTETMWINNFKIGSKTTPANNAGVTFVPDLTTPMLIGTGPEVTAQSGEGGINMNGVIDEVAIYNEILPSTSIANHFAAASNANYATVVQSDNPILYYRFNDGFTATNAGYASSTFPVATNYGNLGTSANGVYQPGTTPGVAGPSYVGFGGNTAVAFNGWFGGVDVGGGNIPAALNPVGKVPFTIVSWFQGNSADAPARYQDIVGHGGSSYRLALGTTCGENRFNPGPANTELQFANATDMITNHAADNDGKWHMAAGVTDGTNAYMYLDGVLVKSTNSLTGISIAGSMVDLLIGGDPGLTYANFNSAGTDRAFDGQIAQVAAWNTNLTTAQIQSMFNAAGVPPNIVTQPVGATNNAGTPLSIPAGIAGSQPISYQWYSTNGAAVSGQTNSAFGYTNTPTTASGSYYLVATSSYGSVTSSVVSVLVYGAPAIQVQSQSNLDIFAGASPVLDVVASGAAPISYQWYSNNVLIASATGSSYTVANVQNSASYTVVLSNFVAGGVTSSPINITVQPAPTAPYPAAVIADGAEAFWRLDESSGLTAFDYVGGNNGTYTNVTLDFTPAYNPISVYQNSATDPSEGGAPGFGFDAPGETNSYVGWIPTNVNFGVPAPANAEFSVECWLSQYQVNSQAGIISQGYGNGGEEYAMDTGGGTLTSYFLRFYVRNAAGAVANASSSFSPASDGNWHHVVGVCDEANGVVKLYLDGTNVATASIATNSGIMYSPQSIAIGSRQASSAPSYNNQFFGAIDEVAVYNHALTAAQVEAHYLAAGVGPVIDQISPGSQTVNMGSTATFTATVTGTGPLTYQWTGPNGVVSTNSALVISNAQAGSQGSYTLSVNNPYGSASQTVNLQVNLGPPVLVQDLSPATETVELYSGLDTISYTIVVSGSAPFSYQWYLNGTTPIAGATNATYTFTALPGTNTYDVQVTNIDTASQGGGVPLQSSTVTVIGIPVPQLAPANYAFKVKISFPGYNGMPVSNFPALVTLSPSTVSGLQYNQFQGNGTDLRFTDASGTAMLASEIDEWNDNGLSTVWVQIPYFNGSNIWAYWGNNNDTDVPPASSNVWTQAGYQIVYHMKESALPFEDSTGQYPATNGVAPTPTEGVVGHAGSFNGSDYLSPGPVTLSNEFTTYAWVYIPQADSGIQTVWANQVGGYGSDGFTWFIDTYATPTDRVIHFDSGNGGGAGTNGSDPTGPITFPSASWHFMTATWSPANATVTNYLDGVADGSGRAVPNMALTNQLNLGEFLANAFPIIGDIDEARIQYGLANTNWIMDTYLNMAESSFVSYGALNEPPMLYIATGTNNYIFSWSTNDGTFALQTTTDLTPPANWTTVTTPPPTTTTNGMMQQVVDPAAGSHFFRLKQQ